MRMEKMTYFSYKLKTDSAPTINIFKQIKKNNVILEYKVNVTDYIWAGTVKT